MPDDLLGTLLSKATGLQAAPATKGRGLLEFLTGYPKPEETVGPADVLMAAIPFAHNLKHLRRMAGGYGKVPLYHGTTADNAANIMQRGIELPASGESAVRKVQSLYDIGETQWKRAIEGRSGLRAAGYGPETSQLSTGPFSVAERWANTAAFPQGEIYSQLNEKARIFDEARRRGISYGKMYEESSLQGGPDALGIPDKMKLRRPGGVVLQTIIDGADLPEHIRRQAMNRLGSLRRHPDEAKELLRDWNVNYKDLKVDPKTIKQIRVVKGKIEGPEG